jgi:hypothetical protein
MDDEDLVEELLVTVNSARAFAEFRRTQRKECANLLRWLQLVLPLLEELRDAAPRLTDDAYRRLALLGRALAAARRLLRTCNDGSKIYLVRSLSPFPLRSASLPPLRVFHALPRPERNQPRLR